MARTLEIRIPEVYEPLLHPSRYKGSYGGRGSGKSHVFAELLIERCLLKPTRAVCVREFQTSLAQSVKKLLEDKIASYGLSDSFRILNASIETPQGGTIIFRGMNTQTKESIKSLERIDVAWVEEAQTLSDHSLELLRPTLRNDDSELWFSWNPRSPKDPIDKLLRGDNVPPDSIVIRSTYKDNPWFPEVLRREMEYDRRRDPEKYAHVWMGEYAQKSSARVFRNYRIERFTAPEDAFFLFGADWGFSIDPSVLVRCFIKDRMLFVDYEAYDVGVEVDHLPQLFDRVPESRRWQIVADSARPETISYLQRNGFPRLTAARKGKDSVKEGIIFLQSYDIILHPRCEHTIDEFGSYSFKSDPLTSVVSPILEDKKNHVIDSLRYSVEPLRNFEPDFVTW